MIPIQADEVEQASERHEFGYELQLCPHADTIDESAARVLDGRHDPCLVYQFLTALAVVPVIFQVAFIIFIILSLLVEDFYCNWNFSEKRRTRFFGIFHISSPNPLTSNTSHFSFSFIKN